MTEQHAQPEPGRARGISLICMAGLVVSSLNAMTSFSRLVFTDAVSGVLDSLGPLGLPVFLTAWPSGVVGFTVCLEAIPFGTRGHVIARLVLLWTPVAFSALGFVLCVIGLVICIRSPRLPGRTAAIVGIMLSVLAVVAHYVSFYDYYQFVTD